MSVATVKSTYFYDLVPIDLDIPEDMRQTIVEKFPVPQLQQGENVLDINHAEHGSLIADVLLILNQYSVEKAANGNDYLKLSFGNNAGAISAKMWDNNGMVAEVTPLLDEYALFYVSGKVEEFPRNSGKKSVTVTKVAPYVETDVNPFSLLPSTELSLEELTVELFAYLDELEEPHRTIGLAGMNRFWKEFVLRPAAKSYHHNYLGGLLKHTVGLMRIARYILDEKESYYRRMLRLIKLVEAEYKKEIWENLNADHQVDARKLVWSGTIDHLYTIFNGISKLRDMIPNRSLLITAIFYHDIGKLLEYTHAGKGLEEFSFLYPTADQSSLAGRKPTGITMDPLGALVGHMPYGVLLFAKIIETEQIKLSIEDVHHYNHCILSHHGKHEWQSTVVPATPEAYLLHFVDFLDSRYESAAVNQ